MPFTGFGTLRKLAATFAAQTVRRSLAKPLAQATLLTLFTPADCSLWDGQKDIIITTFIKNIGAPSGDSLTKQIA